MNFYYLHVKVKVNTANTAKVSRTHSEDSLAILRRLNRILKIELKFISEYKIPCLMIEIAIFADSFFSGVASQ